MESNEERKKNKERKKWEIQIKSREWVWASVIEIERKTGGSNAIGNLIPLRHLIRKRAVTNRISYFEFSGSFNIQIYIYVCVRIFDI